MSSRGIINIQLDIHLRINTVVYNTERSLRPGRIGVAVHIQKQGLQKFLHLESQLGCRRIIQDIPCREAQFVLSVVQGRNTKPYPTLLITSKVELEIIVQRLGLRHVSVNHQLEVMTDATSRGVDTILVADFCHEVRGWVYFVAIDK